MLVRERDFYNVYPAFMALGHAFHAVQDFFAHSNYVELMAGPLTKGKHPEGVPVGDSIASYGISPAEIPLPQALRDFNLAGLKRVMGPKLFSRFETGWASTPWIGEEDFCASKYWDLNPLKKGQGETKGLEKLTGLTINPGRVATPPKGFRYCHYATTANPGLNKDEPFRRAPSPRTRTTRSHATRRSRSRCSSTRRSSPSSAAPPRVRPSRAVRLRHSRRRVSKPRDYWPGTWETSTGGFAMRAFYDVDMEIAKKGKDAVQLYNKLGSCPGSQYYRGGYLNPNDRGKIMGCGTSTHIVGRWLSNEDGNTGSFDITITSTNPPKFRGWAQSDGGGRFDWSGTWLSSSGSG